jgi:branched-chain amino acid transport system substrate-binding protein
MLERRQFGLLAGSTVLAGGLRRAAAQDSGPLRIGGLATLQGPFAEPGKDSFRGMELALEEAGYSVAGRKVELSRASSDGNPDVALASARRLIEQDHVQIFVGPLSGSEGIRN